MDKYVQKTSFFRAVSGWKAAESQITRSVGLNLVSSDSRMYQLHAYITILKICAHSWPRQTKPRDYPRKINDFFSTKYIRCVHLPVFCFVSGTCGTSETFIIIKEWVYLQLFPKSMSISYLEPKIQGFSISPGYRIKTIERKRIPTQNYGLSCMCPLVSFGRFE